MKNYDPSVLKKIDPRDDSFVTAFSNKEFKRTSRNHKIVKYILASIEKEKYHNDIDFMSDIYSIEHVLPEAIEDNWDEISDDVYQRCVYRLGNLTILEKSLNRQLGNTSYDDKKKLFSKSSLNITKAIPEHYNSWGEEEINNRQGQLAKVAKSIWRF